jgi:hypothetical protein
MNERDPLLLPTLAPPSGGWARLVARRDTRRRDATSGWTLAAAACSGACTALLLLALRPQPSLAPSLDRLRGVPARGEPVALGRDGVAQPLAERPGVRFYWTASLDRDEAR